MAYNYDIGLTKSHLKTNSMTTTDIIIKYHFYGHVTEVEEMQADLEQLITDEINRRMPSEEILTKAAKAYVKSLTIVHEDENNIKFYADANFKEGFNYLKEKLITKK